MVRRPTLVILGATGLIGNEIVNVLDGRALACDVRLFATDESAGELFRIGHEEVQVEVLNQDALDGAAMAIVALPFPIAKPFLQVQAGGPRIIDCSRGNKESDFALACVAGVNASRLKTAQIVRSASPATVLLAPVFATLSALSPIAHAGITVLASVSGAGKAALDELWNQTLSIFNQKIVESEVLPHQIAFNCYPQVDEMGDDGQTWEESRIAAELAAVLGVPCPTAITVVRVPTLYSYSAVVQLITERPVSVQEFTRALEAHEGISVYPEFTDYPTSLSAANTDEIHIGRIRRDPSRAHGLQFWITSDNVRRGVALNAVKLAEQWLSAEH